MKVLDVAHGNGARIWLGDVEVTDRCFRAEVYGEPGEVAIGRVWLKRLPVDEHEVIEGPVRWQPPDIVIHMETVDMGADIVHPES